MIPFAGIGSGGVVLFCALPVSTTVVAVTSDEEREHRLRVRRYMWRLMLSTAFAGGVLFGLLFDAMGLSGVWVAPVVLLAGAAFWVFLR